ncbi:MAG: ArsR/SmtB family transcription factor, partial [Candidatus Thorarchaeota archaeon]
MVIISQELTELKEKVNSMINEGIKLEIPVETHISTLEEKINLFSSQIYHKNENTVLKFIKALNNPNRIRIIQLLKSGARCSCELEYGLKLSQPTISHHIRI